MSWWVRCAVSEANPWLRKLIGPSQAWTRPQADETLRTRERALCCRESKQVIAELASYKRESRRSEQVPDWAPILLTIGGPGFPVGFLTIYIQGETTCPQTCLALGSLGGVSCWISWRSKSRGRDEPNLV